MFYGSVIEFSSHNFRFSILTEFYRIRLEWGPWKGPAPLSRRFHHGALDSHQCRTVTTPFRCNFTLQPPSAAALMAEGERVGLGWVGFEGCALRPGGTYRLRRKRCKRPHQSQRTAIDRNSKLQLVSSAPVSLSLTVMKSPLNKRRSGSVDWTGGGGGGIAIGPVSGRHEPLAE